MTITKVFIVDENGVTIRFISVDNCASKFCGPCIIKRTSNCLFDTKNEFNSVLKNCVAAKESTTIKEACETAHFVYFSINI